MERSQPDHSPNAAQRRSLAERMRSSSRRAVGGILLVVFIYAVVLLLGAVPGASPGETAYEEIESAHIPGFVPPLWAIMPFVLLLLTIAVFPLLSRIKDWWHHNRNRFLVATFLGAMTLLYYGLPPPRRNREPLYSSALFRTRLGNAVECVQQRHFLRVHPLHRPSFQPLRDQWRDQSEW